MDTGTEQLARLRLNQLISPALPIGAFTYSQGLEWAVEAARKWRFNPALLNGKPVRSRIVIPFRFDL